MAWAGSITFVPTCRSGSALARGLGVTVMPERFISLYFGLRGASRPKISKAHPTPAWNLTSSQNQAGSMARNTTLAPSQVFPRTADPAAYKSAIAPRMNRPSRLALRGMRNNERLKGPMKANASQNAPPTASSANNIPSTVTPVEAVASSESTRRIIPAVIVRLL